MENFVYIIVTPAGLTFSGNISEKRSRKTTFMEQCCQILVVSRVAKVKSNRFQLE